MKVIQINESDFERVFKETFLNLELESLRGNRGAIDPKFNTKAEVEESVMRLYRGFRYQVARLKDKLEEA